MNWALTLAVTVAALVFLFVRGLYEGKRAKAAFRRQLSELYGRLPVGYDKNIKAPGRKRAPDGYVHAIKDRFLIDEITWRELDMDAVFHRLNYTFSQAGEEYLYGMLHCPAENVQEAEKWEYTAAYFDLHHQERVEIQELMQEIGKDREMFFYDCLAEMKKDRKSSVVRELAADALYPAAVFLALHHAGAGFFLFTAVMIFQVVTYFQARTGVLPYIRNVAGLLRMVKGAEKLFRKLDQKVLAETEKIFSVSLSECVRRIRTLERHSFWVLQCGRVNSSPLSICGDYIRMLLHPDIIQFVLLKNKIAALEPELCAAYACIGFIDSSISIAMYRASLENYCIPELYVQKDIDCGTHSGQEITDPKSRENKVLCMTEGYHPLLEKAVANSVILSTEKGVLLTGSNASGKSTFLKTAAVNLLLAQTIHTALAERFSAPLCRIYTAMQANDDIGRGVSSYMAEILSLKRVLDAGKREDVPVFCFVDEILRGTNTVERIAASAEILKSFVPPHMYCFTATHDRELTKILAEEYDSYHFTEKIRDGEITFPYRLYEGSADTSNAIRLLGAVGYDREIVEKAMARADEFLKEGVWK